ncbi:MAG: hypothetical protein V3V14_14415 [Saprospiraceae bacterium]
MKFQLIIALALVFVMSNCTKEEPILDLKITPSSLDFDSGTTLVFDIDGKSEFLAFYSGLENEVYSEYPNANATTINMLAGDPSFAFKYNYHGDVKAVFVATSFGNWGKNMIEKVYEFDLKITDNNTDLSSLSLKTPTIFGNQYDGSIDLINKTVTVKMPESESSKIDKLTTNIKASSSRATVFLDGAEFGNNSSLDFSENGSKTFKVISIGGAEQEWKVEIELE